MTPVEDAVVLLESTSDGNTNFGSAFIIGQQNGNSYLLTCAHVVEQINDRQPMANNLKIRGLDAPVEIVKCGSSKEIDMALLKVAGLSDKPVFTQFALGQPQTGVHVSGYSSFEKRHLKRPLKGRLGKLTRVTAGNGEAPFWDILILDDELSRLDSGYSGSPVYDSKGQVLAIVSHKRSGAIGHAFCISNLLSLYPKALQLIPALQQLQAKSELEKLKAGLALREDDISDIYPQLIDWIDSLDNIESDKDAKRFLSVLKSFLADIMTGEDVGDFFGKLLEKRQKQSAGNNALDYQYLARRLRDSEIVLCIGADLPSIFDSTFQPASALPQKIARLAEFDYKDNNALAEVCEHAQLHEKCTRTDILSELESLSKVPDDYRPDIELYELLSELPQPFLSIVGGFDTSLECYLKAHRHKFVSVICNVNADVEKERLIVEYPDSGESKSFGNEDFSSLQLLENGYSIIYYPRGYPSKQKDTALLAERDYFDSQELPNRRYPDYLRNKLTRSGLWFLGYQPDSWETRLLAKVLQEQRGKSRDDDRAIVIQENADSFARLFWDYNRCHHYAGVGLKEFVDAIKNQKIAGRT